MASSSSSNSIVEDWLRSVNLVQYTQSFMDNGYDDLEVCKQIGEDDLDAIGVSKEEHRERLLRAVKVLKEEGGTAVYFTLEECDTCQSGDETEVGEGNNDDETCSSSSAVAALALAEASGGGGGAVVGGSSGAGVAGLGLGMHPAGSGYRVDAYDMGKTTLLSYPKVQLKLILRDRLVENGIDLASPPYTNSDMVVCGSSLTALAIRFAEELRTHFVDVLERLEELWLLARNNEGLYTGMCRSPSKSVYSGGSQSLHYGYPGYGPAHYLPHHPVHHPGSPHSQPPPLPSCPPPSTMSSTSMDRCTNLQAHLDGGHLRPADPYGQHQNYVALDGEPTGGSTTEEKKKSGSVFGRFLRNIGFRRSHRKGTYKQHQDLNAYEISMSDEDRMALMILVKEGKISTQTALAVVQKFEEEKRFGGSGTSEDGKENVCDTPSKKSGTGKKKKGGKPTKSLSTLSADEPTRGPAMPPTGEKTDMGTLCAHQVCRQRRVHSLGQLDSPHLCAQQEGPRDLHPGDRMALTRAVSCSPACTPSHKISYTPEHAAFGRLHSPSHHQQLPLQPHHLLHQPQYIQQHHHHLNKVDALRERLTGKPSAAVPKTSSKTSLLSSGSDQSMECGSQTPLRPDPMPRRAADVATYNSNSTVSMSSDTNSPAPGRKKSSGLVDPRLKCHRSASCSTGDDGISSENDEQDHLSRGHRKQDSQRHKHGHHSGKKPSLRVKEAIISRPPLLRQLSAPVGNMGLPSPYLGQAKVIVDYSPGPEEEEFIPLKKGEIVNIINMAHSGVWRGVVNGRQGKFRFEHVEVIIDPEGAAMSHRVQGQSSVLYGQKDIPTSVEDLLQKIGLQHLSNTFMVNGYDDLDIFSELDDHDLDTLHVTDPEQRTKLLSAAHVLTDWHEKMNVRTPTQMSMDSPSSRAGNSSCDSGCYAGGEGPKHQTRRRGGGGGRSLDRSSPAGYQPSPKPQRTPCRSCGKPKQPRKNSGPAAGVAHFMMGQPMMGHYAPNQPQYHSSHSPYAPGHYQMAPMSQYAHHSPAHSTHSMHPTHYTTGHGGYAPPPHMHMSASRTLTEISASDNSSATPKLQTFAIGKQNSAGVVAGQHSEQSGAYATYSEKGSIGDRVSLTEEDQEVIAITYGTTQGRKLSTPAQPLPSSSSQLDIGPAGVCSPYAPLSGCPQCDQYVFCDSASCSQCLAYTSCPQCVQYRHYVNTTMRSDSKSSKMSCSSTCTQTTCLSPDHEEGNAATATIIDYTPSPSESYYGQRTSPGRGPMTPHQVQHQHQLQAIMCTPNLSALHHSSGKPHTPDPQVPPSPAMSVKSQQLTLALADSTTPHGVAMSFPGDPPPPGASPSPAVWAGQADGTEAPGMATLYSRGKAQAQEKSEGKSEGGQVKSPTRSLMPLVSTKLNAERIDLTQMPYSNTIGHCGIPPLLVQRYAEELRQDMDTMALVLEQLREKHLRAQGRPYIQSESLSDSCKSACDLQISSIHEFLISIGLPMYQQSLTEGGILSLDHLLRVRETELEQMTGADSRHLKRVAHALEWVRHKLSSPSHKARASGGVTDKV